MASIIEIRVPDIGDFHDVPVVEIPVRPGDMVAAEDTVAVLESDKATLDVPTPRAGRISGISVAVGDRVGQGSVLLLLEVEEAAEAAAPRPVPPEPATVPAAPATAAVPVRKEPGQPAYASPSVRHFARSLGVAIAEVPGTGPKGRITRADVEALVKARLTTRASAAPAAGLPDWPKVDFAAFGPVDRRPLSRIERISGPALARNAMVIPHVCNFDRADVTETEAFRKALNAEAGAGDAKVSLLAFAVKAVVAALKAHPRFNASLDGEEIVLKRYWNIGVAADTPEGLVVPVVHGADTKGLREIAAEMAAKAALAREGRLRPADMQGATFTISSLGGIGGTGFTPIINAPEVAILGLTRAGIEPVWDGAAFQPRLMQPLSLSWDHRAVDGVAAARFLGDVARNLAEFRRVSV